MEICDGVTPSGLSLWLRHRAREAGAVGLGNADGASAYRLIPRAVLLDRFGHPARGFAGSGAVLPKIFMEFAVGVESAGAKDNEGSSVRSRCPWGHLNPHPTHGLQPETPADGHRRKVQGSRASIVDKAAFLQRVRGG